METKSWRAFCSQLTRGLACLASGYPGGQLALSLDVTCTAGVSAVPCIAAVDPSGTVNSAGLTAAPTVAAVPEPDGMALLGCGVVALGIWRRRELASLSVTNCASS